jgi:hypothetical protein
MEVFVALIFVAVIVIGYMIADEERATHISGRAVGC